MNKRFLHALLALVCLWPALVGAAPAGDGDVVVRQHSSLLRGRALNWESRAGLLDVDDEQGRHARMFYVAYVTPSHGGRRRPVTFLFNGGPGASSMWLHMGSFGPWRANPAETGRVVDNQDTLLDQSDLVFVDAPGTGFSRVAAGTDRKAFDGVDADADIFARFVASFLTRWSLWDAPRFLVGESYGAPRAAVMLERLARGGVGVDGAILISPILNFGIYAPGTDQGYLNALPSMAAVNWYHQPPGERREAVTERIAHARSFAEGPYLAALIRGNSLPEDQRKEIASTLHDLTGLPTEDVLRRGLKIDTDYFLARRLAPQHAVISRTDGRIAAPGLDEGAEHPDFDPQDRENTAMFQDALQTVLSSRLAYHGAGPYVPMVPGLDEAWDWRHTSPDDSEPQTSADTVPDLAAAIRDMPHLRVLVMGGRFDLTTPFAGTLYDLSHAGLTPEMRKAVSVRIFDGGHVTYLDPTARHAMRAEMDTFYAEGAHP